MFGWWTITWTMGNMLTLLHLCLWCLWPHGHCTITLITPVMHPLVNMSFLAQTRVTFIGWTWYYPKTYQWDKLLLERYLDTPHIIYYIKNQLVKSNQLCCNKLQFISNKINGNAQCVCVCVSVCECACGWLWPPHMSPVN